MTRVILDEMLREQAAQPHGAAGVVRRVRSSGRPRRSRVRPFRIRAVRAANRGRRTPATRAVQRSMVFDRRSACPVEGVVMFRVQWHPSAVSELTGLWTRANSGLRQAITSATNRVNKTLQNRSYWPK